MFVFAAMEQYTFAVGALELYVRQAEIAVKNMLREAVVRIYHV